MATNGFVKFPRVVFEHTYDGRLTPTEFICYITINGLADPQTGLWVGSARALAGMFNGSLPDRTARTALEGLTQKKYLKRFPPPGGHGNHPILVHGYEITEGPRRGMRLYSLATTDLKRPVYESSEREL